MNVPRIALVVLLLLPRAAAASGQPADNVAAGSVAADNVAAPPASDNVTAKELVERKAAEAVQAAEETHDYLEQAILDRVVWFDDFFGNVRTEESRQPEYTMRWVNSVRWEEGGRFRYRTSLRANVRLPKMTERLRLVVAGENDTEPAAGLPEDPGNPGFDRGAVRNARLVNTELRYGFLKSPAHELFLGAGVRVALPFEEFVRSRFQYTRTLGELVLLRAAETVFWRTRTGFGQTTECSLERRLDAATLLRWANSGTLTQKTHGLEWGSDLSLLRELSPRSAVTFAAGLFGNTRPAAVVTTYRILSRYRRNVLARWLFVELEPEIAWPRGPTGAYTSAVALTTRAEIVFHGRAGGAPADQPR